MVYRWPTEFQRLKTRIDKSGSMTGLTTGNSGLSPQAKAVPRLLSFVSTERGFDAGGEEEVRIISVRKANPYEDDWFDFG